MEQIADGMKKEDWVKMKTAIKTLKSASGYIGAGRVYYACFYI